MVGEVVMQPHDNSLEETILGCLMFEQKCFDKVEPYVHMKDAWYTTRNWILYRKLSKMHKRGEKIDLVTVNASLSNKEREDIDSYWLSGLTSDIGMSDHHVEVYAKQMYEKYLLRKTISVVQDIKDKAYDNSEDVYDVMASAHSVMGELLELRPSMSFDMDKTIDDAIESIVSRENNLVQCGYTDIDRFAGGFTKGEITIVGGRPGHGKTTFLINLASKLVHKGYRVLLLNRELPNTELIKKLLCIESGKLSYSMVRSGTFGESDIEELEKVKNSIKLLYTSDKFCMYDNVRDFKQTQIEVKKFKPDVIIDDYIQLIEPDKQIKERRLQLERICNDYKWLAKSEGSCVILASQLNRHLEIRGKGSVPQLTDLAESGAIEQVAENVLFCHYHWKLDSNKGDVNRIDIVSRKCRYGMTGQAKLWFNGDKAKLYNTEDEFNESL